MSSAIDFVGKTITGLLDVKDRDLGRTVTDGIVGFVSNPVTALKQRYQERNMDCRSLFVRMGWKSNPLVRAFEELGSSGLDKEKVVTVEMLVTRQSDILKELEKSPPRPWHIAKAAFVVAYCAACMFVDIVLFLYIQLAAVAVAAFQVSLLLAFPKVEEWVKG